MTVWSVGSSSRASQTQKGPTTASSSRMRETSAAGMYRGPIVSASSATGKITPPAHRRTKNRDARHETKWAGIRHSASCADAPPTPTQSRSHSSTETQAWSALGSAPSAITTGPESNAPAGRQTV